MDRTQAPETHPLSDIDLQIPQQEHLSNGIPLFILQNEQLDLIHFVICIKAGILHETIKHTAQFSYALLKESSPQHTATEIADIFDYYGTNFSTSINLDHIRINFSTPKNNVCKILPTIYEFLANPHYREENLSIYKNLKIKDLEYNAQKTDVQATRLMLHAMFGDEHTAGQFSTRENLQSVSIQQMEAFHHQTFVAENASIFVTGNLDAEIKHSIHATFEQIPHGVAAPEIKSIAMPVDKSPIITQVIPNSVQSSIVLCMPAMGYNDPDRCDFATLSTITGGYFGSRLMQNLRERNGYTYGISSGLAYFGNQSLFVISSDVNINQTKAALDACFEELQRLQDEDISDAELENAKSYILGDQIRDLDNSVSILKRHIGWNHFNTDEREFHNIIEHVKAIDANRIKNLSKKYFERNKFTQIIVGDLR